MHLRRTILCIAVTFLWATHDPDMASGQSSWQSDMDAGVEAYVEGDYAEAGKQFAAAVKGMTMRASSAEKINLE